MPEYDNSMRGVLFRNDKKESDKHPDYKGNGEINGVEVWISSWIKTSSKGMKYMSLSFENKEGQLVGVTTQTADAPIDTAGLPDDDDIPF